ncbi:MAG TPA: ABC transporter ATP-binding protein [Thermoleophilia bacterium]|nr:ABC transporter ATP-binding protein [Thermoleophilia bacterium]
MSDRPLEVKLHHHLGRIDLDVELAVERETVALIGASGAGKTSVLLAIAGLLSPDRGRIVSAGRPLFDSQRRVDLPPEERRVGLVFQNGALFPFMSVAQNVAFGLHPRARSKRERSERVGEILERFAIAPLAASRPDRISGGERQRVALARAVATSPDVLLLDEPLSALDAVTKSRVADELSRTLAELRLPTILVSHDLGDVAGLADRVAVMETGRIVQAGTTAGLLRAPVSPFVAAFVGTNYFAGEAKLVGDLTEITLDDGVRISSEDSAAGRVAVVVQPWDITLCSPAGVDPAVNSVVGLVTGIATRGGSSRVSVATSPSIVADIPVEAGEVQGIRMGVLVAATWSHAATRVLPLASGNAGLGAA